MTMMGTMKPRMMGTMKPRTSVSRAHGTAVGSMRWPSGSQASKRPGPPDAVEVPMEQVDRARSRSTRAARGLESSIEYVQSQVGNPVCIP
jgi:hypothetical protein